MGVKHEATTLIKCDLFPFVPTEEPFKRKGLFAYATSLVNVSTAGSCDQRVNVRLAGWQNTKLTNWFSFLDRTILLLSYLTFDCNQLVKLVSGSYFQCKIAVKLNGMFLLVTHSQTSMWIFQQKSKMSKNV